MDYSKMCLSLDLLMTDDFLISIGYMGPSTFFLLLLQVVRSL
jgi:hypothetical protein